MNFEDIKAIEDSSQLATYAKMDIAAQRGEGAWIWDSEGRKYLDLYGGHAVCAAGHCHPHVVAAIQEQSSKLLFYSNLVYSEIRATASKKLLSISPPSADKVFFCNSGAEANENAMRLARMVTGREKVITFTGGFHGRTADSISATFLGKYRELGKPNVPGHISAEFGNLDSLRAIADKSIAAILLEPIQSMAGVKEAPPEYFISLRKLCDEKSIILIFDEVQTGTGRTGNWFFSGSGLAGGAEADIITLAKSLGSGIPVGACIVNKRVASSVKVNDLGTTFGGGMIAMAAVLATIEAIEKDGMLENAAILETLIREKLDGVSGVTSVKGKGCLLGIEFDREAAPIHKALLQNRMITGTSSDASTLRLLPPMCISQDQAILFVEAVKTSLG